jgi:hypothetical protein
MQLSRHNNHLSKPLLTISFYGFRSLPPIRGRIQSKNQLGAQKAQRVVLSVGKYGIIDRVCLSLEISRLLRGAHFSACF